VLSSTFVAKVFHPARSGDTLLVMRRCTATVRWILATVATLGATSCVGEREFPVPTEMCENLVQACGVSVLLEHENDIFRECYDVGVAGQKDKREEAQCFAFYDECINECEFYGYYLSLDGGVDADLSADAAQGSDAAIDSDATISSDE
jgi:hypothetical protein